MGSIIAASLLLGAVDRGDYRALLHALENNEIDADGTERALLDAEAALYLDDLEGCEAALDRLPAGLERRLQCRVDLIRAEVAFWRDTPEEAGAGAADVAARLAVLEDSFHVELRARLLRARALMRVGADSVARPEFCDVMRVARATSNEYLYGLASYCLGFVDMRASRDEAGLASLTRALDAFKACGAERWVGKARVFRALGLADLGRVAEAVLECDEAVAIAVRLGIWRDATAAEQNAARAYLLSGRTEKAIARLRRLVDEERYNQHGYYESCTRYSLGFAYVLTDDRDGAVETGHALERLAALIDGEISPEDGRLFGAWADMDTEALAELALRAAPDVALDAAILLADCLAPARPSLAYFLLRWTERHSRLSTRAYSRLVVARVKARLAEGTFPIVDGGGMQFPDEDTPLDLDAWRREADLYLHMRTFLLSGGNQSEASRRLLVSRSRFNSAWLSYFEGAPRLRELVEAVARPQRLRHDRVEDRDDHTQRRQGPCAHLTATGAALRPTAERRRDERGETKRERQNDDGQRRETKESGHHGE